MFESPLLRIKWPLRIEPLQKSRHLFSPIRSLELINNVLFLPKPDQFFRRADQLLIELIEAAITGQGDDGLERSMNSKDIATMLGLNGPSHRSERRKIIQVAIHRPDTG